MKKNSSRKKARRTSSESSTEEFERLLRRTSKNRKYVLKLYVTGTTQRSSAAIANIRFLCERYLAGRYDLLVVDIYQEPSVAADEHIIAAPTLVKECPSPVKRMVGDLSDPARVLIGLDLKEPEQGEKDSKTQWARV